MRESLHFYTYIDHSKSLLLAGNENLKMFKNFIYS